MRPVLFDTNAYTAFKRGDTEILAILQQVEVIGISPIVLGELISGFDTGSRAQQNREELTQFLESPRMQFYPLTPDTALFYSKVYVTLKSKGNPIPTNDMWIAAQALENGCMVCTYDKHFSAIDGLLVIQSLAELMP
jgi:tRNA(fMet)-specific endonuclease VapC